MPHERPQKTHFMSPTPTDNTAIMYGDKKETAPSDMKKTDIPHAAWPYFEVKLMPLLFCVSINYFLYFIITTYNKPAEDESIIR